MVCLNKHEVFRAVVKREKGRLYPLVQEIVKHSLHGMTQLCGWSCVLRVQALNPRTCQIHGPKVAYSRTRSMNNKCHYDEHFIEHFFPLQTNPKRICIAYIWKKQGHLTVVKSSNEKGYDISFQYTLRNDLLKHSSWVISVAYATSCTNYNCIKKVGS